MSTSGETRAHFTGQYMDGGATASTDATHVQEVVKREMAERERIRAGAPISEPRVGTRSDGSFGLLDDELYVDGKFQGAAAEAEVKGSAASVGSVGSDELKVEGDQKDDSKLKRRVSKMVSRAVAKVRGPQVARGM